MSKSSLGSRSLASMQSAGFSDINYRRRMISQANSRTPSVVGTNPYGGNYDTYQKSINNTIDTTMSSYDMAYGAQHQQQPQMQPQATLGSHMSPGGHQFNDLHEVHYMPGMVTGMLLTFKKIIKRNLSHIGICIMWKWLVSLTNIKKEIIL